MLRPDGRCSERKIVVFADLLTSFPAIPFFDVVGIDGFVCFAGGRFSSIGKMFTDNIEVSSRCIPFVVYDFGFHNAENLTMIYCALHESDEMFASFRDRLDFRYVNGFRTEVHNKDT